MIVYCFSQGILANKVKRFWIKAFYKSQILISRFINTIISCLKTMGRKYLTVVRRKQVYRLFLEDVKDAYKKIKRVNPRIPEFREAEC